MDNRSDFFDKVTVQLSSIANCDIALIPDLMERGKNFIMSWLKDVNLKEHFANDAVMYYYNVASIAFAGGIAYADAWEKDITQIKLGTVDTLLSSQRDIPSLAMDIVGMTGERETEYRKIVDSMFSAFLDIMAPFWDKEDPRPFLFQGLLAFFVTGNSFRLK